MNYVSNKQAAELVKIVLGLDGVETVEETGEVVCCFNCDHYNQKSGFCSSVSDYREENEACKSFVPASIEV